MNLTLLTQEGLLFLLRWFHFVFGIVWIGLLYYFNFVQGAFFNETDAPTKSNAIQKLVPRALWWFRWGAMGTFLTGWIIIIGRSHSVPGILDTGWGTLILTGAILGSMMWANVWFVIWPNQKIVIQSATQAASGGQALPNAAAAGARALVASRTNVLFSFPMLFFMGAASHLPIPMTADSNRGLWFAILAVILAALEFNALKGKTGPLTTVKGVIHAALGFTVLLYVILEAVI